MKKTVLLASLLFTGQLLASESPTQFESFEELQQWQSTQESNNVFQELSAEQKAIIHAQKGASAVICKTTAVPDGFVVISTQETIFSNDCAVGINNAQRIVKLAPQNELQATGESKLTRHNTPAQVQSPLVRVSSSSIVCINSRIPSGYVIIGKTRSLACGSSWNSNSNSYRLTYARHGTHQVCSYSPVPYPYYRNGYYRSSVSCEGQSMQIRRR
ncbi:hypothetical protein [Motilimonas pumila]|uniref:Uncharacterized protein n=1 Tax=Motilimonas pumila TaxID=2303987 RepID=A0A418YIP4_9GAMM|nr:hypothetical protein [Motilimonas pumila]RJG50521.1 hypothetical protein D1Z90_03305 [Motilimonas pumila]